jgi:cobalamin synthase
VTTRKIGGVTGDIIGATSEIVETLVLAAGAVLA